MSEHPVEDVIARIRAVYGAWGRDTPVERMRRDWDALCSGPTVPHGFEPIAARGVPAAWIATAGADEARVILYLHGGGFRLGSIASHRGLMARLSGAAGCRVLGLDYRLVPEHCFPAAVEDATAVYRAILATGTEPGQLIVAGDSAGGGLALSLMLKLKGMGRAMPAAALLMSPWTDLAATGESYVTRAESDPIHQRPMILAMAKGYLGPGADPHDPLASPLYGDLAGLPPLTIQVGDRETVLDDARVFAARAREAGVPVVLQVADGMFHVFQLFGDELPEARNAIAGAGDFLCRHLGGGGSLTAPVSGSPHSAD